MDSIAQQFFNLAIMERALPLVLAGLQQTIILCLLVIPLGLAGGLAVRAGLAVAVARRCAGRRLRQSISSVPFRRWCC